MELEAGYLIVRQYVHLYRQYAPKYDLDKPIYAIPRVDKEPGDFPIQYRGLDRDALAPYDKSERLAEIRLSELKATGDCFEGFLSHRDVVDDVVGYLDSHDGYEIIWARIAGSESKIPEGFVAVGFEPTYFWGDHFSASCDCMMIPRWHGSDRHGTLFKLFFEKLNQYGLFQTSIEATEFLEYYLSFDWTETGDYEVAEICIVQGR